MKIMSEKMNQLKIEFDIPYGGEKLPLPEIERLRDKIFQAVESTMRENKRMADVVTFKMVIGHVDIQS